MLEDNVLNASEEWVEVKASVIVNHFYNANFKKCSMYLPWYIWINCCIYKIGWQEVKNQEQKGFASLSLHKPQI